MNTCQDCKKTMILMGAPGSGKGTLCQHIMDHPKDFSGQIISLGFLLRQETLAQTPLGLRIEEETKHGDFLSGDVVEQIILKELRKYPRENIIFDGFPRTPSQQIWLENVLPDLGRHIDHVVVLTLDYQKLIERLSQRKTCLFCHYVGGMSDQVCPLCQHDLVVRADDNADAIIKRIDNYNNMTEKMITEKYSDKIIRINTDIDSENVYKEFMSYKFFS